jgi:hypothetical protein
MNDQHWNRRILALLLAVLAPLALLLMLSLRGFVRETILIPLSYAVWIAGIFIRSTPQAVFWGLLVAVGLILAIRSLWVVGPPPATAGEGEVRVPRRQRVGFWIFQVYLAREGYARVRFADFFSRLALETLAFREGVTPAEAEARLQEGELETTPEVLAFLRIRRLASSAEEGNLFGWLAHRFKVWIASLDGRGNGRRRLSSENELEKALSYLEDQLEVKHDV